MERKALEKYLTKLVTEHIPDIKWRRNVSNKMKAHGFPSEETFNLLNQWERFENVSDEIIACFYLAATSSDRQGTYLTKEEIKKYSKWKEVDPGIKWPITFRAVRIARDQWIGATSVTQLNMLRKAQLIKYDPDAQRPLERKVVHGKEIYQISLNENAVNAIQDAYKNETFIPNVITLNIPVDSDLKEGERPARFSYDDSTGIMEIKFTEYLAITDGYHRFVAMEREKNHNPDFEYAMGIMITNFPVNREQQYIYQEDQKTKMSKVASDALNQNNAATQIVERMCAKTSFSLHDGIKRNGGTISSSVLNAIINALYGSAMSKSTIVETGNKLIEQFEEVVAQDLSLLDQKWDWRFLVCTMVSMYNGNTDLKFIRKFYDDVHKNEIKADPASLDRIVINRFIKRYETL